MKIMWISVSPEATTGYGRMTREIVGRLLDKHEVICVGHVADVIVWGGKHIVKLPRGREVLTLAMVNPLVDSSQAVEMVRTYIARYNPDLLIGHWDAFALEFMKELQQPYLVYIPVDGVLTEKWVNYVRDAHKIVLYSKFGYNEFLRFVPPSKLAYIPHGVDTETFKPLNEDKAKLRREIQVSPPIPEDCFLFLFVGANVGDRKKIPLLLKTFSKLAKKYKDVHILLHTNPYAGMGRGYDLLIWVDMLKIKDRVHFPTFNPILEGISDEEMCKIYNSADIYVTNSCSEGFGLPLIEAQACGLPVIAPRNSAQEELVEGHGWLVNNIDPEEYIDIPVYVPQLTEYPVPNQKDLLSKLEEAYHHDDMRKKFSRLCREFALEYDWRKIMTKWDRLLGETLEELNLIKTAV